MNSRKNKYCNVHISGHTVYRANGRGGFGSQTGVDPFWWPLTTPGKQTVGTVTASHKMLSLQALSSSLNAGTAKRGCLG